MKIRIIKPIPLRQRYLAVASIIALLFAAMVFLLSKTLDDIGRTKETIMTLRQSADAIRYYDEVLTMSARMGAASGDTLWQQRYDDAEPKLDAALQTALRLYPAARTAVAQTSDANDRLIGFERRAFALVEQGRAAEAFSLLLGQQYAQDKRVYANGLAQLREGISSYSRELSRRQARRTSSAILAITLLFVGFTATLFLIIRQLHHRQEFERTVGEISARFVASREELFDESIPWTLERLATMVKADLIYLVTVDEGRRSVDNHYLWCKQEVVPSCGDEMAFSYDEVAARLALLGDKGTVRLAESEGLQEWTEGELALHHHIKSQLLVPIIQAQQVIGYMAFCGIAPAPAWSPSDSRLTQAVADIISRALHEAQIEKKIVQHERELASILENLPNMVFAKDARELRFVSFNRAGEELLGIPREQMIGKNDYDLFPREQADFFNAKDRDVLSSGKVLDIAEEPIATPRGQRILHTKKVGLLDERGEPELLLGISEDITERIEARREVERIRSYLDSVVNSMPSLLAGLDLEGRVTHWNREAEQLSGVDAARAIGQPLVQLLPVLAPQLEQIGACLQQGREMQLLHQPVETASAQRYWNITLYPLLGEEAGGAVLRVDDVTEHARMEQVMVQTEKMLSVGGLAAGMAHELNNPLGGILQGLQNIRRRLSPQLAKNGEVAAELGCSLEAINDYLERRGINGFMGNMAEAGERAADIVRNMLQFSRKAGAELKLEPLEALIDSTLALAAVDYDLKKQYDFRQIEIVKEYDPQLTSIRCIAAELQQVLLNLFRNAAQALYHEGQGQPRITVRTRRQQRMACIEVEDNGPGMEREVQEHVFEPFFTTRPVGEGTGLGLSVSYFIITQEHGGTLSVDSTPGKGSRFTICLAGE